MVMRAAATASGRVIMQSWPPGTSSRRQPGSRPARCPHRWGSIVRSSERGDVAGGQPEREERRQAAQLDQRVRRIRQVAGAHERPLRFGPVVDVRVEDEVGVGVHGAVAGDRDRSRDPRALRDRVDERLPVERHRAGEPDDATDPLRHDLRDARNDDTTHRVTDEHDVVQVLEAHDVRDVVDERLERDVRGVDMGALAESRERRRVHLEAGVAQRPRDLLPAPSPVPAAVHEHERR